MRDQLKVDIFSLCYCNHCIGSGNLLRLDDPQERTGINVMSKRNELERLPPREFTLGVSPSVFDYSSVPLPLARLLKGQVDRIRHHHVTSIANIGKALLEAKRHLSHEAFQGWVESEVCMPVRTAQAYMRVAHWVSARKKTAIGHLPPRFSTHYPHPARLRISFPTFFPGSRQANSLHRRSYVKSSLRRDRAGVATVASGPRRITLFR